MLLKNNYFQTQWYLLIVCVRDIAYVCISVDL